MSIAEGLDHVGVAVRDLDLAAAAWEGLGFALTGLARHAARAADGSLAPTGTGNRCIMLRQGYVELIAVVDPAARSATLERFLSRYCGIHIVTFAVSDEQGALARLRKAGFATEIAASERPADPADPDGPQARFARLPLADAEPRLQLLRHLTPELVWQERFLHHPNRAVALDAVVIVAEAPAVVAARLSRAAGVAVLPDPAGGYALVLAQGRVRILPPESLGAVFPGIAIPSLPFVAGIVVRTDDGNAAVARLLAGRARPASGGLLAEAGGVAVLFAA
ncbi:VOC family protein [Limobrevibacterium gyesilva]|uniref:VOC family protein n=1 Tax=Limobrevibacterium gyesilva TaxID=2991712 RepID=A0AA41YYD7_9PROT|nr:VOC family protein [Limobrevibacterium gyesilva]MCW3477522.1 VOC family protein [Limobrevibacterium gyesilva]